MNAPQNIAVLLNLKHFSGKSLISVDFNTWIESKPDLKKLFVKSINEYKNNRKTRVALINAPLSDKNNRCFLKAFHSPSLIHRLYRVITHGRAYRSFHYSSRLKAAGVNVPEPYAYLEGDIGEISSYYFCEDKYDSLSLNEMQSENTQLIGSETIFVQIGTQLARLHGLNLKHGDFKWGNILIDTNTREVAFIDLDAVAPASSGKKAQDIARFLVNCEEACSCDSRELLISAFLDGYTEHSKQSVNELITQAQHFKEKVIRKHRKKYPQRYQENAR